MRFLPDIRAFVRLRCDRLVRGRESASDIVQSVCREVLERAPDVEVRDGASFRSWLFGAVLNKVRDRRKYHHAAKRDPGREARLDDAASAAPYASIVTPSGAAIDREEIARMEAAFDELPEHYREVITLARIVRLSSREIGERTGRSEKAVRHLLQRALVRLASILTRKD